MQIQARDVLVKLESAVAGLGDQLNSMPELSSQLARIHEQVQSLLAARETVPGHLEQTLENLQVTLGAREHEVSTLQAQLAASLAENQVLREQQATLPQPAPEADPELISEGPDATLDDMARRLREALRDRDEAHQEIVALRAEIEVLKRANASLSVPSPSAAILGQQDNEEVFDVLDAHGHKRRIGEILVSLGVISDKDRDDALSDQSLNPHRRLGSILVERNLVSEELVAKIVARQLDLPFVRLTPDIIEPAVARMISIHIAKHHSCLPLSVSPTHVVLAMANPFDLLGIDDVELATGRRVEPVVTTQCDIMSAIARIYDE